MTCFAREIVWDSGKDDFTSMSWKEVKWNLVEKSGLSSSTNPSISIVKNYYEKTGVTKYWITFNTLQNEFCFFPIYGEHKLKIDDDIYDVAITNSKSKYLNLKMLSLYTEAYLTPEYIDKIRNSGDVTVRFLYASGYSPSTGGSETFKIPEDVLKEFKKIFD
jgi:hypothetical protein